MLDEQALRVWAERLGFAEATIQLIHRIRAAAPARRVQGRRGNVRGCFPSRKMGHTIQYESLGNELSAIYLMEYYETDVLEYWDQPPSFPLRYATKTGVQHGHLHTPDFFVLREDGAGWEEWKSADEMPALAERMPARYVWEEQTGWQCPPGQAYARAFGLSYRVRTSAEIHWELQRNLRFLADYWRVDEPARWLSERGRLSVQALVTARPGLTLQELSHGAEATLDEIYLLLATGEIFVDLCAAPLVQSALVRVYAAPVATASDSPVRVAAPANRVSVSVLAVGTELSWDGRPWRILNLGERQISLLGEQEECRDVPRRIFDELLQRGSLRVVKPAPSAVEREGAAALLRQAGPAALQEAARRYHLLEPYLQGAPPAVASLPARTRQRWLQRYHAAQATHGMGYVGLLPGPRGNRQPRLSETTRVHLEQFIVTHYETLKQPGKLAIYGQYLTAAEAQGLTAVSYKTFAATIARRPVYEQTRKRAGPRAAYVHEPFYYELQPTVPRHGDRPFELVHLDHTELDIELVCTEPYRQLGRPWATFLTDAYSRRLLAVLLLYDPPSYRTNMMILRECVRRHQRFPETLIVDGGKDFHSLYFDALLAAQECTKRIRPGGKARFGSVIERLFGVSNQQFIHNLQGNTQLTRNVRQVTKAVAPVTQAVWTLPLLYERFCEWAYEVYDTRLHGRLEESPRAAFERGLARGGQRAHRLVQYDEAFRLLTLPSTQSGVAKVVANNGVKIHQRYYWANAFRHPAVSNTQVPVRYDPYDAGQAFAYAQGIWVTCYSEHYHAFHGRTERELLLASSELRKRQSRSTPVFKASAQKLAAFLTSVEAQEALLVQRLRDLATKQMFTTLDGAVLSAHELSLAQPAAPAERPTVEALPRVPDWEPELYPEY